MDPSSPAVKKVASLNKRTRSFAKIQPIRLPHGYLGECSKVACMTVKTSAWMCVLRAAYMMLPDIKAHDGTSMLACWKQSHSGGSGGLETRTSILAYWKQSHSGGSEGLETRLTILACWRQSHSGGSGCLETRLTILACWKQSHSGGSGCLETRLTILACWKQSHSGGSEGLETRLTI